MLDEDTSKLVCRLITGIVVIDDHLHEAEDKFVDKLLDRFGLDQEERGILFPIMDGKEAGETLRALDKSVQDEAMTLLIEAAAADQEYVEEEREYLHAVAETLGISKEDVDRRVEEAMKG